MNGLSLVPPSVSVYLPFLGRIPLSWRIARLRLPTDCSKYTMTLCVTSTKRTSVPSLPNRGVCRHGDEYLLQPFEQQGPQPYQSTEANYQLQLQRAQQSRGEQHGYTPPQQQPQPQHQQQHPGGEPMHGGVMNISLQQQQQVRFTFLS
jgi:hypothetical protein